MSIDPRLITPPGGVPSNTTQIAELKRRLAALEAVRTKVGAGSITGGMIGAGAINSSNIAAGTLTAALLTAGSINAGHIQAGAISAIHIAANSLTSNEIATGTITALEIAAATILGANIAASTITSTNIASATITGDLIAGSTITADLMAVTSLSAISANMGTLSAGKILVGSSSGAKVAMGSAIPTSTGDKDGVVGTDSSNALTFWMDSATGNLQLKGTLLTGSSGLGNISGQIHGTDNVQLATITGDRLVFATITAGLIQAGTITAAQIAAGTITADRLSVTALSAITANLGTITAGTITGATLQTAVSGSRVLIDIDGLRAYNETSETLRVDSFDGATSMTLAGNIGVLTGVQFTNPSGTTDSVGWTSATRSTTFFRSGPASLMIGPNGATGRTSDFTNSGPGLNYFTAGVRYQFVVWARTESSVALENTPMELGLHGLGVGGDLGAYTKYRAHELDTTWRRFTLDWVPTVNRQSSTLPLFQIWNRSSQNIYIDDLEIREFAVPAVRHFQFTDIPGGNRRGSLYGWREEDQDNATMVLESAPNIAELDRPSSVRLQVVPGGLSPQAMLSVNYDPTSEYAANSLEFEFIRPPTSGWAGRRTVKMIDSSYYSDFLLAAGEHVKSEFGGYNVGNGGITALRFTFDHYDITANGQNNMHNALSPGDSKFYARRAGIYFCVANLTVQSGGGFGWVGYVNHYRANGTYVGQIASQYNVPELTMSFMGIVAMEENDSLEVWQHNATGVTQTYYGTFAMSRIGALT
jgi:hypothetical protein